MEEQEWYHCPVCNFKICKINPHKHIEGVYIKCKKCGNIIEIKNEPEPEPVSVR